MMTISLNSSSFSLPSYVLLGAMAAGAAYLGVLGRWFPAAGLAGIILLAILFIAQRSRLPSIFTLLFVLAGLVNAVGYVLNLWRTPYWFDEAVHFYTSFTAVAAIGWLLFSRTSMNAGRHPVRFALAVTGIGIVLGLLWEVFEWTIGIIGSPSDTMIDLLMDTLGAVAAGLFCVWADDVERKRGGRT